MIFSSEKGTALIEFTLVFPFLLLLSMGIVEYSFLLYDKAMITNASREGARVGIAFNVPDDICANNSGEINQAVNDYLNQKLINFASSAPTPTVTTQVTTESFGRACTVTVNYPYQFLVFPKIASTFFGGSGQGSINLAAVTIMRMENQLNTGG